MTTSASTDKNKHSFIHHFLTQYQAKTNTVLQELLSSSTSSKKNPHNRLNDAIEYSLFAGGKRIRPCLTYAAALATGQEPNKCTDIFAAAIEAIHTYSLIHDDLPAMDDDDLRRGKPTCHVQFDEATAILAGDALQSLAYEWISDTDLGINKASQIQAMHLLAKSSGPKGMVLGQAIDLASVNKPLPIDELEIMHNLKTGALISASIELGGLSCELKTTQHLRTFAAKIGLAFQVHDDILDVTSDSKTLGKTQGADAKLNKPTYVSLLGLDAAIEKREQLITEANKSLTPLGESANTLKQLAHYIIQRNH